jgi:hypothetical protein
MNKVLMSLAAALCIAGVNAVELDCTFDKKQPAGVSIQGKIQQEDGASVLVNENGYYIGILSFVAEEGVSGTLTMDLTTTGNPASLLGVILHEKQDNGKLKAVKHLAWHRKIAQDKYQTITFNIAPELLKTGKKYDIYFYRSNQKGALKIKRIQLKTTPVAK